MRDYTAADYLPKEYITKEELEALSGKRFTKAEFARADHLYRIINISELEFALIAGADGLDNPIFCEIERLDEIKSGIRHIDDKMPYINRQWHLTQDAHKRAAEIAKMPA